MTRWYLDTSAALKLLLEEEESAALAARLDRERPSLVAGWLLETELRRAAQRESALTQAEVTELLDAVSIYDMPGSLFREAGLLPEPALRSLDALHLAAAIRIGVDAMVAYDRRLTASAQSLGIRVVAPT